MRKKLLKYTIVSLLPIMVLGCKVPYNPALTISHTNYLVVEGMINTGNDSTFVNLSRTTSLNNKAVTQPETGANITIESDANATTYLLKPIKAGSYAIGPLNLSPLAKYRLRIITAGATYLSDFVQVKVTPPIDSLGYKLSSDGLKTYINTHDATNNTRYYRWDYAETWKFHSFYSSTYIASGRSIVLRNQQTNNIYFCWANNNSADILLASSAKLVNDVIFEQPISVVPSISEKVSLGYSILVKQYALTEEAFNFWQNLKKNTEQLGGIFDAQPSQIQGNIHNVANIAEPVFGYISAGTLQQKRITIVYTAWPKGWGQDTTVYGKCRLDSVPRAKYGDYFFGSPPTYLPVDYYLDNIHRIDTIGLLGASRFCIDCTLRGSNKRPSYWPANF